MLGMISGLLGGMWGRIALALTAIASVLFAVLGWRHSIRKGAKNELSAEIQERTLDRIERAKRAEEHAAHAGGDIRERLREQGYLRD